jgi:D-apionate oxidoisomerase
LRPVLEESACDMNSDVQVVTVVGAGGKMGMRISANLQDSRYSVFYCENHGPAQERVTAAGRELAEVPAVAAQSDVVILAVPDVVLGSVSAEIVPLMKPGSSVLTLDPAAAYAGILEPRADIKTFVAHPCHPSIFLERTTATEWADTFGGVAAPQHVVAAADENGTASAELLEELIRVIYAPVIDVHWVSVKQLAVLEPTLVETVTCMISGLLKEALAEAVDSVGIPEEAAKAMLYGHIQVALTNSLRGSNPFSEACHIAMDYGRRTIVKEDWKRIFNDTDLDSLIAKMLHIDSVRRPQPIAAGQRLQP